MSAAIRALPRTHAFILAGGRGERLNPLTLSRPKPLIPFGAVFRIIDFSILNALNSGLSQISILTQYRYQDVHDYIRDTWGGVPADLRCFEPTSGKRYRGTADAVYRNLPIVDSYNPELALILSGDHIYNMDYRAFIRRHIRTGADLTIAAVESPVEAASQFGVIEVDQTFKVVGFQEKPREPHTLPGRPSVALVSMGVYIFRTKALIRVLQEYCGNDRGYDFGHDIIPTLIESERTFAYDFRDESHGTPHYWRDVGTIDSYYDANMDLLQRRMLFDPYVKDFWRWRLLRPAKMGAGVAGTAHVSQSVLSPGVRIEPHASIEGCVLMPNARIGSGARLRKAIVEDGVTVPPGFQAGFDTESDRERFTVTCGGVVVIGENPVRERATAKRHERVVMFRTSSGDAHESTPVDDQHSLQLFRS